MSHVRLREAQVRDLPLLDRMQTPAARGTFNDFGPPAGRALAADVRAGRLVGPDSGMLLVEVEPEGTVIGSVTWHDVYHGPNPESRAWNIGIALLPEARGRGYGGPAQRLLAERLFATSTVNRVEASTDVENVAEQRALEKAGFVREGVLRGAQYRAGRWHDLFLYSLLRDDLG